jgi:hypothetical protein
MSASQLRLRSRKPRQAYNRRDRDNQCERNVGWQSRTRRATYQPKFAAHRLVLTAVEMVIPRAFSSGALSIAL